MHSNLGVVISCDDNNSDCTIHTETNNTRLKKIDDVEELAATIGTLYEEAGDNKKAAYIFRKGGLYTRAAQAMRTTGDFASAREMY